MPKEKDNRVTNARTIELIPVKMEDKKYYESVAQFADRRITEDEKEIEDKKAKLIITTDEKRRAQLQNRIAKLEKRIEKYRSESAEIREGKISDGIVRDYTYDFVRSYQKRQAEEKNYIMSYAFSVMVQNRVQYMEKEERKQFLTDMFNRCFRVKGSSKDGGSLFDNTKIDFILGSADYVEWNQEFKSKIKDLVFQGLLEGKVALPTYKVSAPFGIDKQSITIEHSCESDEDFRARIGKSDCDIFFSIRKAAKFKFNVGTYKAKKEDLYTTLYRAITGECGYDFGGSKVEVVGQKIILHLTVKFPKRQIELDENTVCGVDLGTAIPAVCAINNDIYAHGFFGDGEEFQKKRAQIRAERRRIASGCKYARGGHGRKRKMQALDRFKEYEQNFAKTYNHKIAKDVVDFAVKHGAKYINIERLTKDSFNDKILGEWGYYQLQMFIENDAAKVGIIVRKVIPCFTSQVCSFCGHWDATQRNGRSFSCGDPDCEQHTKVFKHGTPSYWLHADWNAARNIAMSTLFYEDEITEEQIEKAAKHYGIPYIKKDNKRKKSA